MGLLQHILLFLALAVPIVVMGTFYGEPEDAAAFRSLPRRYAVFCFSCSVVALVMLLCEHWFARV